MPDDTKFCKHVSLLFIGDYIAFVWLLSSGFEPNLKLLNNRACDFEHVLYCKSTGNF